MLFYFGMVFSVIVTNSGHFSDRGATVCCRNPLLSPNNFTYDHLMKTKGLIADVKSVESPARAEHDTFGVSLDIF